MKKKLWGGRFTKQVNEAFFAFQKSIQYDQLLAEFDVYHSLIQVQVLKKYKILSENESLRLTKALEELLKKIKQGVFKVSLSSEDIHTEIQNRIEKTVGPLSEKLHSLRSRNDQIAFDERLYCVAQSRVCIQLVDELLNQIARKMSEYPKTLFIGFTHMQRAQVIYFYEYLNAFYEMFERDKERLISYLGRMKIFVGAGALAGNALSWQEYVCAAKKVLPVQYHEFIFPLTNSLATVSDRDFIIDFMNILSILQMHLSRIAEDLVLYATKEFMLISLPEEFCTGSSLMPHKKNPDLLELIRGHTARIYGNLFSVFTLMKGLPSTYNRDMQLDKEPLFNSVATVQQEVRLLTLCIEGMSVNKKGVEKALEDETVYATELTEYLVLHEKVSFRKAHEVVGQIVRYCEEHAIAITDLSNPQLQKFHASLTVDIIARVIDAVYAVTSRKSVKRRALGKNKPK